MEEHPQIRFLREHGRSDLIRIWKRRRHRLRELIKLMPFLLFATQATVMFLQLEFATQMSNEFIWALGAAPFVQLGLTAGICYLLVLSDKEKELRRVLRGYPYRFDFE